MTKRVFVPKTRMVFAVVLCNSFISDLSAATPLEEVVVTARLRAENLQDVSVSVAAMDGVKLREAGIDKVEDFKTYVPNLSMSETGIGTNLYMRGIGSGINQGFEQSVGMYVDGVYYGRAQLTRAPFMDLQRIEALRGPQNILYGKNSIAGAISMITERPSQTFEGMVSASYEPDEDERVYDLVLSGPLSDKAAARLAYRKRDTDGYIKNITSGNDEPERNEDTVRLSFSFDVSENFDYLLKYEHSNFDVKGRQIEIIDDSRSVSLSPVLAGRTWGQILNNTPALGFSSDASVLNGDIDYRRSSNGDYSKNTTDNVTFVGNYEFDKNLLTFTTGWLTYDYDELCDCDFTGAPLFNLYSKEDYEQFSQEVRFASAMDQEVEYLTGIYYQKSKLNFEDNFVVPPGSPIPTFVGAAATARALQNNVPQLQAELIGQASRGAITNISVPRAFFQDTELWSLFAQATWNVSSDFRVIFGGRYSREEKDASRYLTYIGGTAQTPAVLSSVFKVDADDHALKGDRKENQFSPQVVLELDLNDDSMVYFSATKGYKSGGYDSRSNATPGGINDGTFEYDEEKAKSFEVGMKNTLFDGSAELNFAYFYTEYTDLQVSIFDGILGFNVGNAAEAVTQGVEIEGRWQATEQLNFAASLAYLDFEYKDFANGQCPQGFVPDTVVNDQPFCDYKGKTNQYVAPWSANLLTEYVQPLGAGLELKFNLDLSYTDDYNPTQNLDSRVKQKAYTKVNARVALNGNDNKWTIALVGENLADEEILSYANDTPLSYSLGGSVGHYGIIEKGRTVAISGAYRF